MAKSTRKKQAVKPARAAQRSRRPTRVAAMEAALAALAHDIRTPLTGILAFGELLASSEIGERERQWAAGIKNTAEHLAALTSLIVDAARADAAGLVLRQDRFSPRQLAVAAGLSLEARAQTKNLESEVIIADALPAELSGDVVRVRAALENLIDNAVKFTDSGRIKLEVACENAARKRVRLVFTVTDSGIGLTATEIRRLFRPFVQANIDIARRYGGAGLGLVFVKRIAKAMGGDLTVASTPGHGSRFRLTVAATRIAGPLRAGSGASIVAAPAVPARNLKVLCVEDNPYGRVVLNAVLSELGHRTDFVGTGEAAVIAVGRGGHDIVLMDIMLPGIDGIEATRRIRALGGGPGGIPIIGISGRGNADDERAGRAAGMNGYLAKPLSPGVLSELFDQLAPPSDAM